MSDKPESADSPKASFDLQPGLLNYYSAQAELMLGQFENINRLLGPTTNWTQPGDLCEMLVRGFLRRFLPPAFSADKGFIYGRSMLDGHDTHGPEIDILVHDTQEFRPIFRMDDFVIVQPQAVRAMIQVKRTFSSKQIDKGLRNIVMAKQHLLDVLWWDNPKGWRGWAIPPPIFTAIVGFEDEVGRNIGFYQQRLLQWWKQMVDYDRPTMERTSMYVLPSFIGSLNGFFLFVDGRGNFFNQRYAAYESVHGENNISIQTLLWKIYHVIGAEPREMPPFAFPPDVKPFGDFRVLQIDRVDFNEEGIVALCRNDGRIAQYRRLDGPISGEAHVICGSAGVTMTSRLQSELVPKELFIQRDSAAERYERITSG